MARHALPDHVHEAGFPFLLLHSCVPPPAPIHPAYWPLLTLLLVLLTMSWSGPKLLSLESSVFMVLRNFLPGESLTGVSSNHKLVFHKLVSPRGCLIRIWVHFTAFLPSGCVVLGRHFTFPGPGSLSGEKSLPFDSEGTSLAPIFSEAPFQVWGMIAKQDQNALPFPFSYSLPILCKDEVIWTDFLLD